jgi:SOS-response transcriptional repressor LexA
MAYLSTVEVYNFIRDYQCLHGYPPRLREIADGINLSLTAVHHAVNTLVAVKTVTRRPRYPRGTFIKGMRGELLETTTQEDLI